MKVILETGALKTAENIRNASILALYSEADFLKTSTGKEYPGASLEATYIMCECIKEYYEKTGRMVGFKAAGGISTTEDALKYYTIVKTVLGENGWKPLSISVWAHRVWPTPSSPTFSAKRSNSSDRMKYWIIIDSVQKGPLSVEGTLCHTGSQHVDPGMA